MDTYREDAERLAQELLKARDSYYGHLVLAIGLGKLPADYVSQAEVDYAWSRRQQALEADKGLPEEVARYARWHKAAYGWNPFEGIDCRRCGKPVPLIAAYRCFDCDAAFHKECLVEHCREETCRQEAGQLPPAP